MVQSLMWLSVTIINTSHHEGEDSRWSTKRIFWHSSLIFSKIREYWSKMDDGVERVNKSTDNHYHMGYFKLGWLEGMWWLSFCIWCYKALKEPQWDWIPANSKNSTQPGSEPLTGHIKIWLIFLNCWSVKGDWKGKGGWRISEINAFSICQVWRAGYTLTFTARAPNVWMVCDKNASQNIQQSGKHAFFLGPNWTNKKTNMKQSQL